jgi:hypothetical protein
MSLLPSPGVAPASTTTSHRVSHTGTATATASSSPSPSSSPSSTDPGDYSVAKEGYRGMLFCAWKDNGDETYEVYADFTTYYRGPQHPTTVPYEVLNSVNGGIVAGLTVPNATHAFGVKLHPAAQKYTMRLTLDLYPGADEGPSDDSVSYQIDVPAGSPPSGNVTFVLNCE